MDIRVRVHLAHFWTIRLFLALFECSSTGSICCQKQNTCTGSLKKSQKELNFLKKSVKCMLTLMSNKKLIMKPSWSNGYLSCWPNSLNCTDLNQCGVRRDAELCRHCYRLLLKYFESQNFAIFTARFLIGR